MCQQILTDTDIKAIIKQRGFSREANARLVFETFFLSDTGLNEAFASLAKQEIILLHLLKLKAKTVDTAFFEVLYGTKKPDEYATFTQRYTPVFKSVQQKLLRKGLLIISQGKGDAKMEKWRFELPAGFAALLPPLMPGSLSFDGQGETNPQWLRDKLSSLIRKTIRATPFSLKQGRLFFKEQLFSARELFSWHQRQWHHLIWKNNPNMDDLIRDSERIIPLLYYALTPMGPSQWFKADDLSLLLKLNFGRLPCPDVRHLCETGLQSGILAHHQHQGTHYYRLAPPEQEREPAAYLTLEQDGTVILDLDKAPFSALEPLAAIARFEPDKKQLKLLPDMIHLGEAGEQVWKHPVIAWLKQQAKSFQLAFQTLEKRRGKQCIHENLYVAKVTDLSLRIQIQKRFAGQEPNNQVVMLAGDFIAFPLDHLDKIEKLVNKSGFVVKTVKG